MNIAGQTAFVTGANRGIGRRFVGELLARGAGRVYAGVREPERADEALRT
ncbi:short-chain dehydrogenase, partial [Streptomyces sp. SID11233]|nr:short-chain dehydrogenase [Streptomyces sp. SID11233]